LDDSIRSKRARSTFRILPRRGQDRLVLAVAGLLGRAAGGVTFDEEQFGLGGVFFLTVGQLAGQRRNAHDRFAAGLARLTGGFAGGGGINDLLDHGARMARIFLKPFAHPVGHQAFERLAHFGRDQLVLGLRREFRIGQFDRHNSGQAFAHVIASQRNLFLFQHARFSA
jgi:hypothetical protein